MLPPMETMKLDRAKSLAADSRLSIKGEKNSPLVTMDFAAEALLSEVERLELQNDVLRSMNHHMLEALEKIAVIRMSETTGGAMSKSEFWAKEAIGAVKTLENHAEERMSEKREGLMLGESRNLPYPTPITDDEAKPQPWNTLKTMANGMVVCVSCGVERLGGTMCPKCFGPRT